MDHWMLLFVSLALFGFVSACNNGQKMLENGDYDSEDFDEDDFQEFESRRKRALDDPEIIPFFTRCMKDNMEDLSWEKSALYVTFTILQDVWFRAVSESVCRNHTDTADCWKEQIDKLLMEDSVFYDPSKRCIDFYAQENSGSRKKRYIPFEFNPQYYYRPKNQHQEPVCNSMVDITEPVAMPKMSSCPKDSFDFASCMNSEQTPDSMYCDYFGRKKKYDFSELDGFVMKDRTDCKISKLSEYNYDFVCENHYQARRKKRTVFSLFNFERYTRTTPRPYVSIIPPTTTTTTPTTTTTTKTTTTTTTTTTTARPTTVQPPNTNCLAMKLQKVLHPSAPLRMSEHKCNMRVMTKNNFYSDTVGSCPLYYGSWTRWFNEASPTGANSYGDIETLSHYRSKYGGFIHQYICKHPIAIQARVANDHTPYSATADDVQISPSFGLQCINSKGHVCEDYKVRFCCHRQSAVPVFRRNPPQEKNRRPGRQRPQ